MKIGIISDIHGNMAYLKRARKIFDRENIETVICCGDVQTEEAFLELEHWHSVYLVFGNADKELARKVKFGFLDSKNMKIFYETGTANLGKRKIAFCHYDFLAKELAASGKFDLIFYGHTHTPWEENVGKTSMVNPGEITAQFGKPTLAIYDLDNMKAELVLI